MTRRRRARGRPVLGAIMGMLLGAFVGLDLWFGGVIALDSSLHLTLPLAGLVLGVVVGLVAPLRRRSNQTAAKATD